jgi:hypothetical protein
VSGIVLIGLGCLAFAPVLILGLLAWAAALMPPIDGPEEPHPLHNESNRLGVGFHGEGV